MQHPVLGLHHVTATANEAQADLDFCLDVLGLRLVKKTVNFDNHSVYHFYYADEQGTPGTIWTTFPYHGWGVPVGVKGAGQITATSFSVPAAALPRWKARLKERGIAVEDAPSRFGEAVLRFSDPSGLGFELVGTDRDTRDPWTGGPIDHATAIRGIHSVTMVIPAPAATVDLMTGLLGFEVVNETEGRVRLALRGDAPGRAVDIIPGVHPVPAKNGLGTVHHVAFAIADPEEQLRLREELIAMGARVTEVRDRQYFRSIYFREPGGVLFEVATMTPGFAVDEPLADLGRALKLPPWEEPHRAAIEAGLPAIRH